MPPAEGKDAYGKATAIVRPPASPAQFVYDVAGPQRCLLVPSLQELLDAKPEALMARDIKGNYALHNAAAAKAADCLALLVDRHVALDRHFDPAALLTPQGQSPADLVGDNVACRQALTVWPPTPPPFVALRPKRSKAGVLLFDLLAVPAADGQPIVRSEAVLNGIVSGLLRAEAAFLTQDQDYAAWLLRRGQLVEGVTWRSHAPAAALAQRLATRWAAEPEFLTAAALSLLGSECFLHRAIPMAHSDAAMGQQLAPFMKLLHWGMQSLSLKHRHRGASYCVVNVAEAQQMCRRVPGGDRLLHLFRFRDVALAATSPKPLMDWLARDPRKALVVVTPADSEDPNCCPVLLPGGGKEVLFPAGQLYRVTASAYLPGKELSSRLGLVTPLGPNFLVIQAEAVDAFWDMAEEMVKSERQADELGPVMEQRLAADVQMYGWKHRKVTQGGALCVAADLHRRGQLKEAAQLLQQAMDAQTAVLGADHPEVGEACRRLAAVRESLGQWAEALAMYERALLLKATVWGPMELEMGRMCHKMATLYQKQGDRTRALELYTKSRAVKEAVLGPKDQVIGAISFVMAQLFQAEGRHAEALEAYERVLQIQSAPPGPVYLRMAEVYSAMGNNTDALGMYQKVLAAQEEEWGTEALVVSQTHSKMAEAYSRQGELATALELCSKALDIKVRALGEQHDDVALSYEQLGTLLHSQGESEQALEMFGKAVQVLTREGQRPDVARLYEQMAAIYTSVGDQRNAVDMYERATEVLRKHFGAKHPEVGRLQKELRRSQHELMSQYRGGGQQCCVLQ